MPDIAELELRIKSVEARTAASDLDKLTQSAKRAESQEKRLTEANKALGVAFRLVSAYLGFQAARRGIQVIGDYEQGLVGVRKTTDLTGKSLADFGNRIQELSRRIPVTTEELLSIAAAAGQLGIRGKDNLLKFTETVARLGSATVIGGQEAAVTLARLTTITGGSIKDVDRLGSVINRLSNEFAANSAEIADLATRLAQSTSAFKVNEFQVIALATAMKQLGLQTQVSATSVGRALVQINQAVLQGGRNLQQIATVAGLTSEEFAKAFEEDKIKGFLLFIQGLAKEGNRTAQTLTNLGLANLRSLQVLPALTKKYDEVAKAFAATNDEVKKNTSLVTESNLAFNTLQGSFTKFGNTLRSIVQDAGEGGVGGALKYMADTAQQALQIIFGLDDAQTKASTSAEVLANAIRLAVAAIAAFIAVKAVEFVVELASAVRAATVALIAFDTAAAVNPFVLLAEVIAGVVAALGAAAIAYGAFGKKGSQAIKQVSDEQANLIRQLVKYGGIAGIQQANKFGFLKYGIPPAGKNALIPSPTAEQRALEELNNLRKSTPLEILKSQGGDIEKVRKLRDNLQEVVTQFKLLRELANKGEKGLLPIQGTDVGLTNIINKLSSMITKYDQLKKATDDVTGAGASASASKYIDQLKDEVNIQSQLKYNQQATSDYLDVINAAKQEGIKLDEKTLKYPPEFEAQLAKIVDLMDRINKLKRASELRDYVNSLDDEIKLLKVDSDQREQLTKIMEAENISRSYGIELSKEERTGIEKRIAEIAKLRKETELADSVSAQLVSTFTDIVTGTQTFSDAMRQLIKDVSALVLQMVLLAQVQKVVETAFKSGNGFDLSSFLGSLFGTHSSTALGSAGATDLGNAAAASAIAARGLAFVNGRVQPMAGGGLIDRPTFFPMANGGYGLAGEAGTEAVFPLTRTSGGKLGIKASGGGSGTTVIMNVYTKDADSFRRSESQVANSLRRATGLKKGFSR